MSDFIRREDALRAFGLSEKTRKYGGDHTGYDTRLLYEIQDILEDLPAVKAYDGDKVKKLVEKIKWQINTPNRNNCDYQIVDKIENLIAEFEKENCQFCTE